MKSHFTLGRGAAIACAVSSATTMLTGVCSGQIAADYAIFPTYDSGWSAGQNGGFGFTAWSFGGTSGSAVQQGMNSTSPFNQLGRAWTLYNPAGSPAGTDLAQAGRGFAPLAVGQTFETVIDSPSERTFYRGYTIRLGSGADNTATERFAAYTFEYFSYGKWYTGNGSGNHATSLFDTDTAAAGMRLDFTLTGTDTYHLSLTPLSNPAKVYSEDGTLKASGPVDYVLFQLYGNQSDPTKATDFYISGMTILPAAIPEPSSLALIGLGSAGLLFLRRRK